MSHSTVEKQRRDRINSLIDEVRLRRHALFPSLCMMLAASCYDQALYNRLMYLSVSAAVAGAGASSREGGCCRGRRQQEAQAHRLKRHDNPAERPKIPGKDASLGSTSDQQCLPALQPHWS